MGNNNSSKVTTSCKELGITSWRCITTEDFQKIWNTYSDNNNKGKSSSSLNKKNNYNTRITKVKAEKFLKDLADALKIEYSKGLGAEWIKFIDKDNKGYLEYESFVELFKHFIERNNKSVLLTQSLATKLNLDLDLPPEEPSDSTKITNPQSLTNVDKPTDDVVYNNSLKIIAKYDSISSDTLLTIIGPLFSRLDEPTIQHIFKQFLEITDINTCLKTCRYFYVILTDPAFWTSIFTAHFSTNLLILNNLSPFFYEHHLVLQKNAQSSTEKKTNTNANVDIKRSLYLKKICVTESYKWNNKFLSPLITAYKNENTVQVRKALEGIWYYIGNLQFNVVLNELLGLAMELDAKYDMRREWSKELTKCLINACILPIYGRMLANKIIDQKRDDSQKKWPTPELEQFGSSSIPSNGSEKVNEVSVEFVEELIRWGASPLAIDPKTTLTPLHCAAVLKSETLIDFLISKKKVNPNVTSQSEFDASTPLDFLCKAIEPNDDKQIIRRIVDLFYDACEQTSQTLVTNSVNFAGLMRLKDVELVQHFLDRKFAKQEEGTTVVHEDFMAPLVVFAAHQHLVDMLKMLLYYIPTLPSKAKTEINQETEQQKLNHGKQAEGLAKIRANAGVMMEYPFNYTDDAFGYALRWGSEAMVDLLLKAGARPQGGHPDPALIELLKGLQKEDIRPPGNNGEQKNRLEGYVNITKRLIEQEAIDVNDKTHDNKNRNVHSGKHASI